MFRTTENVMVFGAIADRGVCYFADNRHRSLQMNFLSDFGNRFPEYAGDPPVLQTIHKHKRRVLTTL